MSESARLGLSGNLHLVCASDLKRGTYLAEQYFSAPIHLSKSYWDGDALLVNVVNQTAGVFGGDTIKAHVVVEPDARVLLSSPSAARFHPSHGRQARLEQKFEIRAGGSLDVFPEISIPQCDSRTLQKTVITMEDGGELIYLETLAPGRVASGEAFAFTEYSWWTDVTVAGRLVHRERASIRPADSSIAALRSLYPTSYYAGMLVLSPASKDWNVHFLHALAKACGGVSARIAASKLSAYGWSIRMLAADSLALREGIRRARQIVYGRLGRKMPDARRS